MRNRIVIYIILVLFIVIIGCSAKEAADLTETKELTISAAVSLSDALNEIKTIYENKNDVQLTFNFGGSGTLSQQIQQGAPVDLFISANEQWMTTLSDEQLIEENTLENITYNELVLIAHDDLKPIDSLKDFLQTTNLSIAIGHPDTVPAGMYTKQVFDYLNVTNTIEGQLILAKDVRQVLTYVETANTDLGFVYKSDALTVENIHQLKTVDPSWHEPIIYPGVVLKNSANKNTAKDFLEFLMSDEAQAVFTNYGFTNH